MGSPLRVAVLGWSDTLAEYGLFLVMAYLTREMEINFRHAAAIVNLFWGFTAILPVPIRFLRNRKRIPDRWMVLVSSLAYVLGLGFLFFSTLEPKDKKTTLVYASLPLISLAKSGYVVSLQKLISDEMGLVDSVIHYSVSIGVTFLVNIIGLTISYLVKNWSTRFKVPTLCMVIATLIFLTGFGSYGRERTDFLTKLFDMVQKLLNKVIKFVNTVLDIVAKIALCPLRLLCCCFVKKTQEQSQQSNATISRIEETKFIISLFPICLLGLISSLGNTYFLEQAYSMKQKIGFFKVPYVLLLSMYKLANYLFPKLYFDTVDSYIPSCCTSLKKVLNRIGMALSLLCALLCCVIAAKVERKRIDIIVNKNICDPNKITEPVDMSILYLVPQFFLLGGFYGLAYESIERFLKDHQTPPSLKPYMVDSAIGVFGLGNIGSVFLVYLVYKFTSKQGNSWFDKNINCSHLDKYYWLLSVWIAINIVWYLFVSILYQPKEKPTTTSNQEGGEEQEENLWNSLKKLAKKCCVFLPEKVPDCCCSLCCCCCCCCPTSGDPRKKNYQAEQLAT
ncbi:protein NRT1/ PTR FAMILY 5.5 [Cannabis sativa]|uniref:Uncharacterized protein n=1 Tax=Cannabis sativa TaxID=3483 RepID=A0A7J6EQM3_CANSA|nr:protein NRT1/ PTR FAMILY 5.5 [Cannabis sativa]KAF4360665.1 hypothetical protein G4B88_010660 [Cannabis sativa]